MVGESESVTKATAILKGSDIDLVISSMQLSDGCCAAAFQQAYSDKPTILIIEESYDSASMGINVVESIFKPVSRDSMRQAIIKFEQNINH